MRRVSPESSTTSIRMSIPTPMTFITVRLHDSKYLLSVKFSASGHERWQRPQAKRISRLRCRPRAVSPPHQLLLDGGKQINQPWHPQREDFRWSVHQGCEEAQDLRIESFVRARESKFQALL